MPPRQLRGLFEPMSIYKMGSLCCVWKGGLLAIVWTWLPLFSPRQKQQGTVESGRVLSPTNYASLEPQFLHLQNGGGDNSASLPGIVTGFHTCKVLRTVACTHSVLCLLQKSFQFKYLLSLQALVEELRLWRYIWFRSCSGCFKVKVRGEGRKVKRLERGWFP